MNDIATIEPKAGAIIEHKAKTLGESIKEKESNFHAALPAHIPVERFMRVVMTAVQNNPALWRADRPSLWNASMRAAQDGLLPDGREGALVIYKTKSGQKDERGQDIWVEKVQWMPMIAGIRKKVRNSREIATWEVQVVHAKDQFEFELGDDPFIKHKPFLAGEAGPVIAAYSVATLKTGEKSREVMTRAQIEKVRAVSKSKDRGPWVDWYEEMCRKVVARRHSKVLPMSTDLDDLMRRDDDLYDLSGARKEAEERAGGRPQSLAARMDALAGAEEPAEEAATIDAEAQGEAEATPPIEAPSEEPSVKPAPKDQKKRGATPHRDALLADLTATGEARAAAGPDALADFLEGLTEDERAILPPATVKAWREAAARARETAG